jgi:glycosyltransferase involved in cell wall biosynthesis
MISVIIPLYNKGGCIENTIQSVLNQSYTNFELIVVDDGSTDNSVEVVKSFNDNRIVLYQKENGGVSSARNYGIDKVKGNWIFFLDADDTIEDKCLESLFYLSIQYPLSVIATSNYQIIDINNKSVRKVCKGNSEEIIKNPYKAIWLHKIEPRTGNTIIRKDWIQKTGYYNIDISIYEDMEFILRLCRDAIIAYSPKVLFSYEKSNSELSVIDKPLESHYSYDIDLNKGSFYEKLIKAEIVYIQLRRYLSIGNKKRVVQLWGINKRHLFIISYAALYRKIIKLSRNKH